MSITYPKICIANDGKYFIDFILNDKRYRLYNGKKKHFSKTHPDNNNPKKDLIPNQLDYFPLRILSLYSGRFDHSLRKGW